MGKYTRIEGTEEAAVVAALETTGRVGAYQRNLIRGVEAWSGGTLRGRARHWSAVYARSRAALIARLARCGYRAVESREDHGRRVVTISVA